MTAPFVLRVLPFLIPGLKLAQATIPKTSDSESGALRLEAYTVTGQRTDDLSSLTEKTGVSALLVPHSFTLSARVDY